MSVLKVHLAARTSAEWQELMEAEDIICGPIADYGMVMQSPQLAHNGLIVETTSSVAGSVRMPGMSMCDRDGQSRVHLGPPAIGEHTTEILAEFGLTRDEISALLAAGAVRQRPAAAS